MAVEDLTKALEGAAVQYDLLTHEHTESAAAEAQALDLPAESVAKTLIIKTREGYLRVVLPASCRLDERKVRDITGGRKEDVRLGTEDELRRDYPDFELGAVPPLGGSRRDPVIVDIRVKARESIVLEAGSHEQSIRLVPDELVRATGAIVADICRQED